MVQEKSQILEDLIMMNELGNVYGIDTKKVKEWLKRNGMLILIVSILAFWLGYYKGQANIALDCKYAKSVRVEAEAYRCERIL